MSFFNSISLSALLAIAVPAAADAAQKPRKSSNIVLAKAVVSPTQKMLSEVTAVPRTLQPAVTPLISVVSLPDQKITVFSGATQVARSSVSTGMDGHRTPPGIFSVLVKERYHESNLYSNAPMPFMQRITWSGIALHEGNIPGYRASHGCIRLPGDFAQRLFGMTRVGMRVIVADRDLAPVAFSHPALPSPTFTRLADLQPPITTLAENRMNLGATSVEPKDKLLNPMERARFEQGRAKALSLEAQADAQALLDIAAERAADARTLTDKLRLAEASLAAITTARTELETLQKQPETAQSRNRIADLQKRTSDSQFDTARWALEQARAVARMADDTAFRAAGEAKHAVADKAVAEQAARVAARSMEPVSVFVSRKDKRVSVRQGFEPVFEADVEIVDADQPLGTHVFTAIASPDGGGAMSWVAVTIPGQARIEPPQQKGRVAVASAGPVQIVSVSAAAALDRIKLSDEVQDAIAQRLWTGASFMISDHGSSHETGKGTDFVVLTK